MHDFEKYRKLLRNDLREDLVNFKTDQMKGLPRPSIQKPCPKDAKLFALVEPAEFKIGKTPFIETINNRRSHRDYIQKPFTMEELSFLLWSTQGVRKITGDSATTFRTVPSAGARHPFETYLFINHVSHMPPGLYRYISTEHKLCFLYFSESLAEDFVMACYGQEFVKNSAVIFVWTAVPYRTEWRYAMVSYKSILLEAGHVCQNLYLACTSINAGTCAIASYHQDRMDAILGIDGKEEFTIYLSPSGKIL